MRRAHVRRCWIAITAPLLALACGDGAPKTEIEAPPVMVVPAISQRVVDRIEATGQLLAKAEATVAAQVAGEITGISADEGTPVEQGATVVEIDPERRQLEVDNMDAAAVQADAQLREARRELDRVQKLAGHGAASEARLDEARTQVDLARSRLVAAQAQAGLARRALADASVSAPFSGLIARRRVSAGEYVNQGQALFDLVALDPVEVEFHLAERDSSRVAIGQQVEVRVVAFPDETFSAVVSMVSPTIDEGTRTRRVKAALPNPDGRLLPGTFARIDLGVAERDGVVMIPKEAVLQRADGSIVFRLVANNRVERLRVETGLFRGDLVEVRGPVVAGDRIVVRGQTGLIDGSAVSLRNADGSSVAAGEIDVASGMNGG